MKNSVILMSFVPGHLIGILLTSLTSLSKNLSTATSMLVTKFHFIILKAVTFLLLGLFIALMIHLDRYRPFVMTSLFHKSFSSRLDAKPYNFCMISGSRSGYNFWTFANECCEWEHMRSFGKVVAKRSLKATVILVTLKWLLTTV